MVEWRNPGGDRSALVRNTQRSTTLPPYEAQPPSSACRILLVCESALFRHVLTRFLTQDSRFEIAGNVRSGSEAMAFLDRVRTHAVLFDGDIAEMELQATLRRMRERHGQVGAVCCQPLEERCSIVLTGTSAAPEGVRARAAAAETERSEQREFSSEVRVKLMEACGFPAKGAKALFALTDGSAPRTGADVEEVASKGQARTQTATRHGPQVLAIGCSTGGPSALTSILPALPPDFPLPVVIVQHMPPHFTKLLAERLARASRIPVMEAEEGMEVVPGVALVAPGDFHMRLVRRLHRVEVRLTQDELENSCRPAVDVLFRSVAEIYGGGTVATVLTGMGQDGLKGVRVLKERGAPVYVQDKETSVVWGMPGAIAGAGLADSILPLEQIIPAILRLL